MEAMGCSSIREFARRTGRDHSVVARHLRVLKLPDKVLTYLAENQTPEILRECHTKRQIARSGWVRPNYYVVRSITERDGPNPEHDGNYVVPVDLPRGAPLPKRYMGRRVIDGDVHDLRCADRQGQFAVLVRVKKRTDGVHADTHGFIRPVPAHV